MCWSRISGSYHKNNQQGSQKINRELEILIWANYFNFHKTWLADQRTRYCPKSNCSITDDRNYLNSFDAILFDWRNVNPKDLPPALNYQKWALFNWESPHQTQISVKSMALNKFDWIINYRTDSDVYHPYGKVVECNRSWKQRNRFEDKTKSIAWFVSYCETPSDRETYAKYWDNISMSTFTENVVLFDVIKSIILAIK